MAFAGSGAETVTNYGTLRGGVAGGGTAVAFGGGADVLVLEPGSVLAGTLTGFSEFDTIDLAKVQATGAVFSGTTVVGTLPVMNGTAVVDTLFLAGEHPKTGFTASPDGNGGVDIRIAQPLGNIIGGA